MVSSTAARHDVIVVGSGINSLVAAALLARSGRKVCLLERNDRPRGTIRTEEVTLPGFRHDLMSCWYPLFVAGPAFGALKDDLVRHGLDFCHTAAPSGVINGAGEAFVLTTDAARNHAAFEALAPGEGGRFDADMAALGPDLGLVFGLLGGELWSGQTARLMLREIWARKITGTVNFFGDSVTSARTWVDRTFRSDLARAMFAPWVLHTGLGPDAAMSGLMARVIAFTLANVGCPVVHGGSSRLVEAFEALLKEKGAVIRTGAHVCDIMVEHDRVIGVRLPGGEELRAETVICNVTPDRLYGAMLPASVVPEAFRSRAANYRFGRANMQIHLALGEPARWTASALDEVALIHVTEGAGAVSVAVAEADDGLLPRHATIVAGQPARLDPSRVPDGAGQLWIQLQELPRVIRGDAAGEIAVPADGIWTREVAEAYADRIMQRLQKHIPRLGEIMLKRVVLSPADLEGLDCNLVGGDPYSGDCAIDQFGIWRPFPGVKGHQTPVKGLWHIGASTHPGPGLGGGSGFMVAAALGAA